MTNEVFMTTKEVPCPPDGWYAVNGRQYPFNTEVEAAVRVLLGWVGVNPDEEGLKDTPKRVAKAFLEMTEGYRQDPKEILGRVFEDSYDEVVILKDIPFTSLCEHHLLVFSGTADVGYIPGKVVGLSKLARLVDCYAKRLQMQERMTRQIASALETHLGAQGVAVVVRGRHSCMGCRGVKKAGTTMVTSCMLGAFKDKPEARAEFLSLTR